MFVLNIPILPPYNAKTGQSLGPRLPGNYGRPLISKDDEEPEQEIDTGLSITERLGVENDPLDKIIITTSLPKPKTTPIPEIKPWFVYLVVEPCRCSAISSTEIPLMLSFDPRDNRSPIVIL